jgi:hypothetical protein
MKNTVFLTLTLLGILLHAQLFGQCPAPNSARLAISGLSDVTIHFKTSIGTGSNYTQVEISVNGQTYSPVYIPVPETEAHFSLLYPLAGGDVIDAKMVTHCGNGISTPKIEHFEIPIVGANAGPFATLIIESGMVLYNLPALGLKVNDVNNGLANPSNINFGSDCAALSSFFTPSFDLTLVQLNKYSTLSPCCPLINYDNNSFSPAGPNDATGCEQLWAYSDLWNVINNSIYSYTSPTSSAVTDCQTSNADYITDLIQLQQTYASGTFPANPNTNGAPSWSSSNANPNDFSNYPKITYTCTVSLNNYNCDEAASRLAKPHTVTTYPTTGGIHITTTDDDSRLVLRDMTARTVLETSVPLAGDHSIDLSSLPTGLYVLTVASSTASQRKIIRID